MLPLPTAEFRKDFSDAEWKQVEALLPESEQVRVIAENGEREDAYLDAGMETVRACDVLMAAWDGEPARGKGGTADVIAYARELNKPLVLIDAATGAVRRETFEKFQRSERELDFLNALKPSPEAGDAAANRSTRPTWCSSFSRRRTTRRPTARCISGG